MAHRAMTEGAAHPPPESPHRKGRDTIVAALFLDLQVCASGLQPTPSPSPPPLVPAQAGTQEAHGTALSSGSRPSPG